MFSRRNHSGGKPFEPESGVDSERRSQFDECREARVGLAPLEFSDVGEMDVGQLTQLFLADAHALAGEEE